MSISLVLPLRKKLHIDICRDGGSIDVCFVDFWGRTFNFQLPVKRSLEPDHTVVGYNDPILVKYVKSKRISKGNGKPYYVTSELILDIPQNKQVKLARKVAKLSSTDRENEIIQDLVYGIETGELRKNT
jgi:hypothetical protein